MNSALNDAAYGTIIMASTKEAVNTPDPCGEIFNAMISGRRVWDAPTLREVWRTAPYLFDGRAATMQEVFSIHRHGIDRKVSRKEIEALTEFVNSL